MEEFIWRKLKTITAPQPEGSVWTPALDYLLAKRIYRLKAKGTWTVGEAKKECGPDGIDTPEKRTQDLICNGSPFGSLIAKVGGSTADRTGFIFAVGRHCVFQIAEDAKTGPLFLGANDLAGILPIVTKQIEIEIEIAL